MEMSPDTVNSLKTNWLLKCPVPRIYFWEWSKQVCFYSKCMSSFAQSQVYWQQTESPYYQGLPGAPTPFQPSIASHKFAADIGNSSYSYCTYREATCTISWGLRVFNSQNIFLYGAGLYSWFQTYNQECLQGEKCQTAMVELDDRSSSNIWAYNVITKGVVEMLTPYMSNPIYAGTNQNGFTATLMAWVVNKPATSLKRQIGFGDQWTPPQLTDADPKLGFKRLKTFAGCSPKQ